MIVSRKILSLAFLVGGWSILFPTFAEAKTRPVANKKLQAMVVRARATGDLSPDLGFGQVPLPLNQRQVNQFLRNYFNGPRFPRISPALLADPFSANANARRAFALEVFRQRSLTKISGVAGGVFFTPPNGTPYFPLAANNFLSRLPIFRVLGL